ncbi:hypothetical protein IAQ67_15325 [Paenibacillus peoriae]|uniref:Uncharacterized protein n=1 Tax=Paenibacillus peoriae TaxID=59893 RepID=A0A7H0Y2H0_9BACL|nr:hypothetical protein [Paenibacillus peoriae]QNR65278.1 hypothetical protein IAQ67_15325 [Paenibacillus peoriae]
MKKGLKWTLWIVLLLILGGIVLNFYLNYFTFAYALMGVLLLVFSGWGAVAKLNNDVHEYEDQMRRNSNIEDFEQNIR